MSQATLTPTALPGRQNDRTVADLLHRLGDIPASRVLIDPPPGTATEKDVIAVHARDGRLCELVDGVLLENTMGYDESRLALELAIFLGEYLRRNDLGALAGAEAATCCLGSRCRWSSFSAGRAAAGVPSSDATLADSFLRFKYSAAMEEERGRRAMA
jgi:hypothetical protein